MKDRVIKVRYANPKGKKQPYYYVVSWNDNSIIGTYNLYEASVFTYIKDEEQFKQHFPDWLDWELVPLIQERSVLDLGISAEETNKMIELMNK